jgi:hypothetical protein
LYVGVSLCIIFALAFERFLVLRRKERKGLELCGMGRLWVFGWGGTAECFTLLGFFLNLNETFVHVIRQSNAFSIAVLRETCCEC